MDKHKRMLFVLVDLCIVVTLGNGAPVQTRTLTQADAIEYLKRYNYISKTVSSTNVPPKTLTKAVREFQEMVNLEVTGELNSETLHSMTLPRCGFQDNNKKGAENYVAARPWPDNKVSWKIEKYATTKELTEAEQKYVDLNIGLRIAGPIVIKSSVFGDEQKIFTSNNANKETVLNRHVDSTNTDAMARGFDLWDKQSRLKLNYVKNNKAPADININFVAGRHGDGYPFDGPGGVLAHAQYPTDGSVHFDDQENWLLGTKAQKKGIDLFIVAAHEFGHALGLDHTTVRGAVMYPFYSYSSNLVLHQDDIDGIQSLYGKPRKAGKAG